MRIRIEDVLLKKHCPICEGELENLTPHSFIKTTWGCKNECYVCIMPYFELQGYSSYSIYIFDYKINIDAYDVNKYKMEEIEMRVDYWRKDARYLAKIMLNGDEKQ